jgi:hypothetical protein
MRVVGPHSAEVRQSGTQIDSDLLHTDSAGQSVSVLQSIFVGSPPESGFIVFGPPHPEAARASATKAKDFQPRARQRTLGELGASWGYRLRTPASCVFCAPHNNAPHSPKSIRKLRA